MLSSWNTTTHYKWLLAGGVCATALMGAAFPLLWQSTPSGTAPQSPYFFSLIFIVAAALAGFLAAGWWHKTKVPPDANQLVLEEDERLKLWEELSQAGQWYYDLKTHNFTGTQAVLEIYGLNAPEYPEEINKVYDVIEQRVHPKDHAMVLDAIQKTIQGEPRVLDYRIIVNGKIRHLHTKRMPRYDASGNIVGIYGCSQDITELVEAKLAARASEHRMRKLIENSQLLICTIEPKNLVVTFHNNWYETALGYTREEFSKLTVIQVTHPDDRLKSKEAYDNIIAGRSDQERFEKCYITKDGSLFTVDLSLIAIRDPQGHLESIIAVAVDINDRKRIEEELRKSEERLRVAAMSGNIGLWDWNPQTGMVYWTAESFTMIGYSADEAGVHPDYEFFDRVHPDDLPKMKEALRKHYEGETEMYRVEFRIRCADGRWIWNLGAGKVVEWTKDGKPWRVTGIQVDINRPKQLELQLTEALEEIRTNEERFRIAMTSANVGLWDYDLISKDIYWTQEGLALIGCPELEAGVYHEDLFFDRVHPDDVDKIRKALQDNFDGTTPEYRCEFRIRSSEGDWNWNLEVGKVTTWTEDGKPKKMLGVEIDIHRQKQLELDLINAREDAEKANIAKSTFLANMSHEIRTPMTAILGFTELLESMDLHEDEAKEFLRTIQRNGHHLLELINDILDLSKIDAGQFSVDRQPCDYWSVAKDVIKVMQVRAEKQNIELQFEAADKLPSLIDTDAARLRQSLINLVGNALKFTEKGSVRLQVDYLPHWKENKPAVQFQVLDTGIGIEPDKIKTLFNPFVQADDSMSRKRGGTGLGLAITKQITDMLDGEISVESEPGKGSTFTIVLPVGDIVNLRMVRTSTRYQEEQVKEKVFSQ